MSLLELKDVHTHIGAYHILQGVDLTVREGELTMLLGRNGAGKICLMAQLLQELVSRLTRQKFPARALLMCRRAWEFLAI